MKSRVILLAVAALLSAVPASAAIDLSRADVSQLPNGLTLIVLEEHSFPVVSVQMLYKSGSAAEVTGKTGLAHFLEHLAFRASENFPKARATEVIYDSGGEWHGYTAMDQTTYFATMPKDGLALLLEIEADRMARTVIDPAAIEAEKGAVVTELHGYENDPASVLLETVTRTALQAHPYGSPMAGYVSDVERLTLADAKSYYATHYAPGNAVLAVVGDFRVDDVKAAAAKAFADVPARLVAAPNTTVEPPQRGERRTRMLGAVDRRYFQIAYPAPAASSRDFVPFMVLQELLAGGSGLNLHQSGWTGTGAVEDSLLSGAAGGLATWLPPTRDPFLFTISGSIDAKGDEAVVEREVERRISSLRDPVPNARLATAKAAVADAVSGDVLTTEDAAHQLAFFEGIGALDVLLGMQQRLAAVTSADIQRVAQTYLVPERRTVGWMVPGTPPSGPIAAASPRSSADRAGVPSPSVAAQPADLRRLSSGLPALIQSSPLSDTVTVELLLSAQVEGGSRPEALPGLDAIVRSGPSSQLAALVADAAEAARAGRAKAAQAASDDPATRLEQLIADHTHVRTGDNPQPLAVSVAGNVTPDAAYAALQRQFGNAAPAPLKPSPASVTPGQPKTILERIARPLAQGALGYVVEGPPAGTRAALAWRMLLYVLTHDYSGRLGRSAIADKGLIYYVGSAARTDGARTWATLSIGVDPDKADAMESELRAQLARLVREPPTAAEVDAARSHLLGRDLSAAQSNEELADKLTRLFVETGDLRSHAQLSDQLATITPADLAALAPLLANGTVIRIDVAR